MAPSVMKYKTTVTVTTETRASSFSQFGSAIKGLPPAQMKPRRIVSVKKQPVVDQASFVSPKVTSRVLSSRVQKPTKSSVSVRKAKSQHEILHLENADKQLEVAEAGLKLTRAKKASKSRVEPPKPARKQAVREGTEHPTKLDSAAPLNKNRATKRTREAEDEDQDDSDSDVPQAMNKQIRSKRPRVYEGYDEENSSDSDMPPTLPPQKAVKRSRKSLEDDNEDTRSSKRVKRELIQKPETKGPASQKAISSGKGLSKPESGGRKPLKPKSAMAMKSSQDFKNRQAEEGLKGQHGKQQTHEQAARVTAAPEKVVQKATSTATKQVHEGCTVTITEPAKVVQKTKEVPKPRTRPSKPRPRVQQRVPGLTDWLAIAERGQGII